MRLLHICRQYYPSIGGVERFVADLSTRLAARGHQVEVVTLNRVWRRPDRLPAGEVVNGIPVHRMPFIGNALFFVAPAVLRLTDRFDVLHVHNTDFFLDFLAATRRLHRRPVVVSTHGGFFHTPAWAALKRLYFGLITRRSLGAVDYVLPNSAGDERRFAPYARRSVRIENAIDYPAFAGIRPQPVPGRLLTVGRLAPNKNVGALLQALAAIGPTHPDLSLVVVGEGPLRAELQGLAEQLHIAGQVRWAGEVEDAGLRAELSMAEVFLSAATYEGFGLAVLEAMAAGVLPVVNDIEAFRDVIEPGQNGFLVNFNQPAAAGRALLEVLALGPEQKNKLRLSAQARAAAYDWETAIPKFEQVYSEVCK